MSYTEEEIEKEVERRVQEKVNDPDYMIGVYRRMMEKVVTIELTEEEREFLQTALRFSKHEYERRSADFTHDLDFEVYRDIYNRNMRMYKRLQEKLDV